MSAGLAGRVADADVAQKAGLEVTPRSKTVLDLIRDRKDMYGAVLNKSIDPERFVRVALAAVGRKRDLMNCTQESLLGALMLSAQLGLEPDTPMQQAHLVAYGRECTFIVNYRGYVALAHRAGYRVHAEAVFDGDDFSWELGLNPTITHKPLAPDRTDYDKLTHAYAVARSRTDPSEPPAFVVMTKAEIDAVRRRARSQNGPWKTDPIAMAVKSPVRRLSKWMPMSVQMATAAALDERPVPRETAALDEFDPNVIDVDTVEQHEISPPVSSGNASQTPGRVDVGAQADGAADPPAERTTDDALDPMAQAHIDAMSEAAARIETEAETEATRDMRDLAAEYARDVEKQAFIGYLRRSGVSSNPANWSDEQCEAFVQWVQEEPGGEG